MKGRLRDEAERRGAKKGEIGRGGGGRREGGSKMELLKGLCIGKHHSTHYYIIIIIIISYLLLPYHNTHTSSPLYLLSSALPDPSSIPVTGSFP